MAEFSIPKMEPGRNDKETIEKLLNSYEMLRKQFEFLMQHLDSDNVTEINTNITRVKSNKGITEIVGPLLIMKDMQGIPVIRLLMGYDAASLNFVYQLMNASGDVTVNIDSEGNLNVERGSFKGSITIGTGNNVFKADGAKGIWLGHTDFSSAPFRVNMSGAATATNLTVVGGVITGTTIRTAASGDRIELSGNTFKTYNNSGNLEGLVFGAESEGTDNYGDVYLYADGVKVARFYNTVGDGYLIEPLNGKMFQIGTPGKNINASGNWSCSGAYFTNLKNGSSDYALESYVNSFIGNLQSQISSLESRVSALESAV